jgi:Putative beta-barrel porin 2
LNTTHNSADLGVNWIYTSKCSGRLIASEQTAESEPGQQVAINVINSVTTVAFNETATCAIRGNYSAIFNSGTTASTNSAPADKLNNFQSEFIAAGISYTVSDTNSLQVLATITGTDYNNRPLTSGTSALARNITTDSLKATYTKNIEPNLALNASVGVIGVRNEGFNLGLPSGWEPEYSLSLTWAITPKLGLSAAVARTVAPPTNFIANLQVTESANLGVNYQLTPKVSLSAGVNVGHNSSAFTTTAINVVGQGQNENVYGARASVSYAMTPFLGASLSYQYSRTVQAGGLVTPTSVALMSVNYAPY